MRQRLALAALIALVLMVAPTIRAASPPPDRTPPTKPTVDGAGETEALRPTFHFGARDNRTGPLRIRFRCAIDGALVHLCARAYHVVDALPFGRHELRVVAVDTAGNVSRGTTAPFTVVGTWDAASDFPSVPPSENPAHDKYGNTVWSYLYSAAAIHDPTVYHPFPQFQAFNSSQSGWDLGFVNGNVVTPLVGCNRNLELSLHPDQDSFAIVGWRSPYTGEVSIAFDLRFADPIVQAGSNGIIWSIDRGSTTLQTAVLVPGAQARGELTADVAVGDIFYLTIDNRGDSNWDTTVGGFRVRTSFR